jgi:hypothetical protein
MRALLASTAVALVIGLSPAAAMCGGPGQQAQSTTAQAGMCGKSAATHDPMADKPAMSMKPSGMGMCGCCKNMAMMDGMKADDPHKGMDMPKQ